MSTLTKTSLRIGLILLLIQSPIELIAQTSGFQVKAVSCNLWRKNQNWSTRINNVVNLINGENPDVVGIQEGDEGKQSELDAALNNYVLETGPWNDGSSGQLYNTSKLQVVEAGNFGYSSQPDNPNHSDWGDGATHGWLRTCNWVLYRQLTTNEQFYVYNTHLDANGFSNNPSYWRSQEVRLLASRISSRTHQEYPFILIGDLNGVESEEAIQYLKNGSDNPVHMVDTYREIQPNGPGDSFGSVKYDYIMVQDNSSIETQAGDIIYHHQYGWTSDHNQVSATINFKTESTASTTNVKALSFNVRVGIDGGHLSWDSRKQNCIDLVADQFPDFMGIQEALPNQKTDLDNGLTEYWQFGRGREADGSGEGSQIFYKHALWSLDPSENGTFQLSPTPETWGSNGWGFQYKRVCTWGRFQNKITGEHIYVFNTHYPLSGSGRTNCSNLIAQRIASRVHTEDPVILTGDLNADEGETSIQILKGNNGSPIAMIDTWREIHPTESNKGTFSGWSNQPNSGAKIDYVFAMGHTSVTAAEIIYQPDGVTISDHFPIYGTISLGEASNTPPTITNVSNSPTTPTSTESVNITATITDDQSITNAYISWGTSSNNLNQQTSLSGSGNNYAGTIPSQSNNTFVYYMVTAIDNDGNTTTSSINSYFVSDDPVILFADYDNIDLNFTGFAGSTFEEINNPHLEGINTSGRVGTTTQGYETWSGIFSDLITTPVDFSSTPILKIKVYGPKTGPVLIKFEDNNDPNNFIEVSQELSLINQWQELSFDFSSANSNQYQKLVIFFDFGNNGQDTYLFDDLKLVAQPPIDCHGDENGSAYIDDCGVCSGGNTGITPNTTCTDCHGDVNGSASIDACGICSGGNTGVVASSPSTWYQDLDNDGLGDPAVSIQDCNQPTGYVANNNDECPNDASNTCNDLVDCNGDVNGTASIDQCNVCSGGNTGITPNSICTDCHGDVNGTASIDACGICSGGNTGVLASSPSTWYQDLDNDGFGDPAVSIQDCNQPTGYVANNNDECPNDASNTCNDPVDCNGDVNGTAGIDQCNVCSGGNTGITPNSTCTDCHGDVNGSASIDACGICSGGNTSIPIDDCITSINISETKKPINIYPNPFSNQITIVLDGAFSITIFNISGQIIDQFESTYNITLQTSSWKHGVYFIQTTNKGSVTTTKIVKH